MVYNHSLHIKVVTFLQWLHLRKVHFYITFTNVIYVITFYYVITGTIFLQRNRFQQRKCSAERLNKSGKQQDFLIYDWFQILYSNYD